MLSNKPWVERESRVSLERLLPRLEKRFANQDDDGAWIGYVERVRRHFPLLFAQLYELYGTRYDFFFHLESILFSSTELWLSRSRELKALDAAREADPQWFQSHNIVGAVCYVDLFAGNLSGFRKRLPYLRELGVNYLHLMPLFPSPNGDNDGGYAINNYREVAAHLGSIEELTELASELRHQGISLVLDFVFNHTSDEHEWAKKALAGDAQYQEYYRMFPDRALPDAYEAHMQEIFPDEHPGAFTYRHQIKRWVWTTFHNYQWDLNYENPEVFNRMAEELLTLANVGIEILRLDAVAFLWKELGTSCQNLEKAHILIRAFNTVARIAAPALVFKSEAIVHPDEVAKYIHAEECQLSYNPQLMALLWESLATRKVRLLRRALEKRFGIPSDCSWVNYIRCHDDIGWVFSDDDARSLGIDPLAHRKFLNDFYRGRFPGSFASGLAFQENPKTGDCRISGTTASLCGLEKALNEGSEYLTELAIKRILLLHGVMLTIGGIPLVYLGDEIGTLNDYSYGDDPEKDGDSRWVHRSSFDWQKAKARSDIETSEGRIFQGLLRLIQIKQRTMAFSRSDTEFADLGNDHVLCYFRQYAGQSVLVLANFTETQQLIAGSKLRLLGLRKVTSDIVSGRTISATQQLVLDAYQLMILVGMR